MKNKEIQELVQNEIKNNMMDLDEWRINNLQQILFELTVTANAESVNLNFWRCGVWLQVKNI